MSGVQGLRIERVLAAEAQAIGCNRSEVAFLLQDSVAAPNPNPKPEALNPKPLARVGFWVSSCGSSRANPRLR